MGPSCQDKTYLRCPLELLLSFLFSPPGATDSNRQLRPSIARIDDLNKGAHSYRLQCTLNR